MTGAMHHISSSWKSDEGGLGGSASIMILLVELGKDALGEDTMAMVLLGCPQGLLAGKPFAICIHEALGADEEPASLCPSQWHWCSDTVSRLSDIPTYQFDRDRAQCRDHIALKIRLER